MFGIQIWAIFLIFIILCLGYLLYKQGKGNKKQLEKYDGRMIACMWSNAGTRFYLCKENPSGEIELPPEYKDVDSSTITGSVILGNPDKKSDEGKEVDEVYYIQPRFCSPVWWPPERPRKNQVKLSFTVFQAGIPLPIVGVAGGLWTSDMLATLTTTLITASDDKSTLEALKSDKALWDNAAWIKKQLEKISKVWIAVLVGAGGSAIAMLLVWQLAGKIDKIVKLLGG